MPSFACVPSERVDRDGSHLQRLGASARLWAVLACASAFLLAPVVAAGAKDVSLDAARCDLERGRYRSAVERGEAQYAAAVSAEQKAIVAAELGEVYLRMNRLEPARARLLEARAGARTSLDRARAELNLGNLEALRRDTQQAEVSYQRALALAGDGDAELVVTIELNRLRLPGDNRLPLLEAVAARLDRLPPSPTRERLALNLGAQAADLGPPGQDLALRMFGQVRSTTDHRLAAEAYDGLGALYEARQRIDEALRLTERGLWHGQHALAPELLIPLEWRAGRLFAALRRHELALAAYRRSVEHIEAVRADIPVHYVDGRSSFDAVLGPIYRGLTDLLLRSAADAGSERRPALLRQARDTIELLRQTELEDYLRDRCSLGAARGNAPAVLPGGIAVLYPIVLDDRVELLVETASSIDSFTVAVAGDVVRRLAVDFGAALRGNRATQAQAEQLYRWLLLPLEPTLAEHRVGTVIVLPDGPLRLLPWASLHDGRDFMLRRFSFVTAPALSLVSTTRDRRPSRALLAGLSTPGPVLDKLSPAALAALAAMSEPPDRTSRAPGSASTATALREAMALPAVRKEVESIAATTTGSTLLLDEAFTLAAFRELLRGERYDIVHIASHGMFGDSVDSSFIMAHDELLRLDDMPSVLAGGRPRGGAIDLITLSACRTAEGNDRAPLGMSGVAIKARAGSALGTLWPVTDLAADRVMTRFYALLAGGAHSKAEALRVAQLELIDDDDLPQPFFWAPFVLVGDWR